MRLVTFILVSTLMSIQMELTASKMLVCYYGSWSTYREGLGKFDIHNIDPFLCTHVVYAFIGVNDDGTLKFDDPGLEVTGGNFQKFSDLRLVNPELKTLMAVGGGDGVSQGTISLVANDPGLRANFVQALYDFVKQYQISGIDMDWEYPAVGNNTRPEDKGNFVLLLQELKAKFAPENLLLSAAVNVNLWLANDAYDIPQISNILDFINLMTYDFHGSWENVTGHNSPLFPSSTEADQNINIANTVQFWINSGANPTKMMLGMGMYGRTFTLADAGNTGLGAPTTGPGLPGPYVNSSGVLSYSEICEVVMGAWQVTFDDEQKVPHASQGNQWVGYDDIPSIDLKCQYMNDHGLGGAMVWSIEQDDFTGHCGQGVFPLVTKIKSCV